MMDIEQAMEKILELTEQNKALTEQITSLEIKTQDMSSNLEEKVGEISRLKELNMKYFQKLTMEQEELTKEEPQEEPSQIEPKSWDEFLSEW
jgi:multidrug resistance efflux pump